MGASAEQTRSKRMTEHQLAKWNGPLPVRSKCRATQMRGTLRVQSRTLRAGARADTEVAESGRLRPSGAAS